MEYPLTKYLFCMVLFLLSLSACSSTMIGDPILLNSDFVNKQITLLSFDFDNSFKTSDPISAEIWNESGNSIRFPNNYNIRIFEKTNEGWVEYVEKPVTRLPSGDFVFDPKEGLCCTVMISAFPDLPDLNRNYTLRIYVSGLMSNNNAEVEVFAFKDIILNP